MKKRKEISFVFIFITILFISIFLVSAQDDISEKNIFQKAWDNVINSYAKITGQAVGITGKVTGPSCVCEQGQTLCQGNQKYVCSTPCVYGGGQTFGWSWTFVDYSCGSSTNCGDGSCNGLETCSTCPADCRSCTPYCGDGKCNNAESCSSCSIDCKSCSTVCGDRNCEGNENCNNCVADCGCTLGSGKVCSSSGLCCMPESDNLFCSRNGKSCESFTGKDNCGKSRTVNCGTCSYGTCTNNVCNCVAESNTEFCSRNGKSCESFTGKDNCGKSRTVNCGTCSGSKICSLDNVCICPETDSEFCTRLNKKCGNITRIDKCGLDRTAFCGKCPLEMNCDPNRGECYNPAICSDTDGGKNYFVKGYTTKWNFIAFDLCYQDINDRSKDKIFEYFCDYDGNVKSEWHECGSKLGCADYSCIPCKNNKDCPNYKTDANGVVDKCWLGKCDTASGECGYNPVNCPAGKVCDPATGKCIVECTDNSQCANKANKICDTRKTINGKTNKNYGTCSLECDAAIIMNGKGIVCSNGKVCDFRETVNKKPNPNYYKCTLDCISNDKNYINYGLTCLDKSGIKVCDSDVKSKTYGKCIFECNGNDISKDIICQNINTYCDTKAKECVECASDKDCKNPFKPACDLNKTSPTYKQCVECTDNKHCIINNVGNRQICAKNIKKCVTCLTNNDCKGYKSQNGVPYKYCVRDIFHGVSCVQCLKDGESGTEQDKDCKKTEYKYCGFGTCMDNLACPTGENPENKKICLGKNKNKLNKCCNPKDECGFDSDGNALCIQIPKCGNNEKVCTSSDKAICCPIPYDCINDKGELACTTTCINKEGEKGIQCGEYPPDQCCYNGKVCRYHFETDKFECEEENSPQNSIADEGKFFCRSLDDNRFVQCKKGETCLIPKDNDLAYRCCPEGFQPTKYKTCVPIGYIVCKDGLGCKSWEKCEYKNGVTVSCLMNGKKYEPIKFLETDIA